MHHIAKPCAGNVNLTEMTIETISKCYKRLSVVTLFLSILAPLFLIEGVASEKIGILILINLQFHLPFQFLSRVPFGMYEYLEKESPRIKDLARKLLTLFSWMVMIMAIIGFLGFLKDALNDYPRFIGAMMFPAIFLGGYSSKMKLSEE